jgi:hypothetical protein
VQILPYHRVLRDLNKNSPPNCGETSSVFMVLRRPTTETQT